MADSSRKRQIDYEQLDLEPERGRKRARDGDEGHHSLAIRNGHQKRLRHQDYRIGVICALELEMSAIRYMLDDEHFRLHEVHGDPNSYIVGTLSGHNVVITCLPENQGKGAAAVVATNMARTFPRIECRLLVGIGGGVPSDKHDIRLGDVVIGMPEGLHSGVIQYDLGKDTGHAFIRKGYLSPAPSALRSAVVRMQSDHRTRPNKIIEFLMEMLRKREKLSIYQQPPVDTDILFTPDSTHIPDQSGCKNCDRERIAHRHPRQSGAPRIHYGLIASGDRVMRNARRTHLNAQSDLGDVLCFEMEAAGILTEFPCLVIRGISDYADSHKNDIWHHYAAAAAAGCAKELLSYLGSGLSADEIELDHDISSQHRDGDNTSLSQDAKQKLLESLRFDKIEARKSNIKSSHTRTCKWFLETPEYCKWLDTTELNDHHGVLWIKGKPGAGKSTLMKFALDNALEKKDDRTVLHFFFNARGEELEKSTIGMYQTLLWQLFSKLDPPDIKARYRDKGFRWNVVLLQEAFQKAIQSLEQSAIMCFIDALDECDETQIRDMLRFFEDMAELAAKAGIRFNLLFASRHYPHITIKKGLGLTLEDQNGHSDDIVAYVDSELKIGDCNLATQIKIKDEVQRKASGVFMWVVLVVQILNKEHDRGRINTLRRKLQDIPGDLHDLFRDILTRGDDNRDELLLCIQWVLFARRPLEPVELYCILLFQTDSGATDEWNSVDITDEVIKKYILDCSKGLAEITVSNTTVQFIHESVRDFLLKEDWLTQIRPDLRVNFEGQSHEHLKTRCLEYMTMRHIPDCLGLVKSLSETYTWQIDEHPYRKAAEAFPFLDYAVMNVLYHADMAAGTGIMQSAFLENFDLSYWNALSGIFQNDIIYHQYGPDASLQYVLADYGFLHLIEACPFSPSWLEKENKNERYGLSIFWSLTMMGKDVLQATMRAYARNGPPGSKLHELCNRGVSATRHNFELSKRNSVPPVAPGTGEELLFIFMLETGAILLDEADEEERSLLEYAAVNGYLRLAQLLLDRGRADPNFDSRQTQKALLGAASKGHEEIVKLLLADWRVDPNCPDFSRERALKCAAEDGQDEIVKLLLADMRVDPNFHFPDTPTALSGAASNGHKVIVNLLLADPRVDPNIQCCSYTPTALSGAALNGHKEIVNLLLADPRIAMQSDVDLLVCAVKHGHIEFVRFLLDEQRVSPGIKNEKHRTPLSSPARRCHAEIVKLLFDNHRLNPATDYDRRQSPLLSAVVNGHMEIVKLLLDKSRFRPDMKDNMGRTPLFHAVVYNRAEIVNLLLADQRVDPNTKDKSGRTPLSWAAENGLTEVIKSLLGNKHVKTRIRDDEKQLIKTAWSYGKDIMKLLLAETRLDPNILTTPHDMTLLSWTAWNDDSDLMELLLKDPRVDPNIQDAEGRSALLLATERRSMGTLQLLLSDSRVDRDLRNKDGKTALSLAKEMDDEVLVSMLH